MTRANTRIGDIFSVKINNNTCKYFQIIAFDLTQLNSDVIRAFKEIYTIGTTPDLLKITSGEVEFYAHCVAKLGLKLNLWEKIGHILDIGDVDNVTFRGSNDSGSRPGEQVKISYRWYVWKINGDRVNVGKLEGENKKADIGIVVNPYDVVERMKTGKYSFFYPGYE